MQEKNDTIGQWLLSIPRDDIPSLTQTPEYSEFLKAFQKLECAHRKMISGIGKEVEDGNHSGDDSGRGASLELLGRGGYGYSHLNFHSLQKFFDDDMILRIFEFLNCHTLTQLSETCNRFWILSNRSAKQRTIQLHGSFYLESYMKLLRAKEQIQGIHPEHSSVRIPLMALGKRIHVSNCGDPELNGIYYCTGTNGNGFLFSKPRFRGTRKHKQRNENDNGDDTGSETENNDEMNGMNIDVDDEIVNNENFGEHNHRRRRRRTDSLTSAESQEISFDTGTDHFPRCIISKRYSEAVSYIISPYNFTPQIILLLLTSMFHALST